MIQHWTEEMLRAHQERIGKGRIVRPMGPDTILPANRSKPTKARSKGEEGLEMALKAARAPTWLAEYRFDPERRWRADFAFLEARLLVEVEGGAWSNGRHTRGKGFEADCEKYNEMTLQGWRLLRVTTGMVEDGRALGYIMRALADWVGRNYED